MTELTEVLSQLKDGRIRYVLPTLETDLTGARYIICGFNPGYQETVENRYFVGPAGQVLNEFLRVNGLVGDLRNDGLLFNQTIIASRSIQELYAIKEQIGAELFDALQEHSAEVIAKYARELKLPIWIFGKSKFQEGDLFWPFWAKITELEDSTLLFVYSHPAYQRLEEEFEEHKQAYPDLDNGALFKKIGQLNIRRINR